MIIISYYEPALLSLIDEAKKPQKRPSHSTPHIVHLTALYNLLEKERWCGHPTTTNGARQSETGHVQDSGQYRGACTSSPEPGARVCCCETGSAGAENETQFGCPGEQVRRLLYL